MFSYIPFYFMYSNHFTYLLVLFSNWSVWCCFLSIWMNIWLFCFDCVLFTWFVFILLCFHKITIHLHFNCCVSYLLGTLQFLWIDNKGIVLIAEPAIHEVWYRIFSWDIWWWIIMLTIIPFILWLIPYTSVLKRTTREVY